MIVFRIMQALVVLMLMADQLPKARSASRYSSSWREDRYDCYTEKGEGLRLQASHVDKYASVNSLRECEEACNLAFFSCKSFSFSYYHNREPENCLLSREDSYTLDLRDDRDFYRDADFVYYEKASGRDCDYKDDHTYGPQGDSCYELVKTRSRMDSRYIIRGKVLRTRDRRECEMECDREYDCRGFNYRINKDNEATRECRDEVEIALDDQLGQDSPDRQRSNLSRRVRQISQVRGRMMIRRGLDRGKAARSRGWIMVTGRSPGLQKALLTLFQRLLPFFFPLSPLLLPPALRKNSSSYLPHPSPLPVSPPFRLPLSSFSLPFSSFSLLFLPPSSPRTHPKIPLLTPPTSSYSYFFRFLPFISHFGRYTDVYLPFKP
ncbi:hypothetical protein C7M84_010157 [Penaeus vannamei]|uniref:Apple domain-containing protein n=1 Tax=Penaeus vannamei TaxID=6689 RepID=A0A3R7M498_PENVA|nr:hypothetical protein C7M84_010157 [Penaeus vannamei]